MSELSDTLLTDNELCNIIAIANSRDYSEIEFIGHISICQDRKTSNYYETVIIPARIKDAERKLIEEIEAIIKRKGHLALYDPELQQLKQKRGK
jgi:hypothetical protein